MHGEFTLGFESCFVEIMNLIGSKEEDENKKLWKQWQLQWWQTTDICSLEPIAHMFKKVLKLHDYCIR